MAEIAEDKENKKRVRRKISVGGPLPPQASHVERMLAGVAAEIISAKREQKSSDREAQSPGAADRLEESMPKKTSSHAETCEDVGGAIHGESVSAKRLQKFAKDYLVPEAETAAAGAADACWLRLRVYF